MGYTQMDLLPLLQVTSVVGIWGISFCLFLLPATIAAVLTGHGSGGDRMRLAIAVAVFLAAVDIYGSWRLASTPVPQYTVKVGLMATGVDTTFPHDDSTALELFRDYSGKVDGLAAQGPKSSSCRRKSLSYPIKPPTKWMRCMRLPQREPRRA